MENNEQIIALKGMYQDYFLDYASYVILERAVPHINDGLKPVQRRILHSMYEMEDGRYNKVANIIGNCMKYHPHGDASIGDALVGMGQKELLIDCQGNWGNIYTGDSAAAARYIEARLSKFAEEVVYNPKTTNWQTSYDGRNNEPITLPVKFPLLLAHGVEGIAVGLASKIMPHNFIELIQASIEYLKGTRPNLVPDFLTGGMADFSRYNEGVRGGKIRVRARMHSPDKKTIIITEIPFSTTTQSLIDSILAANEKGKIKIRKVEDNTAKNVEIVVQVHPDSNATQTIDALYAFTDCEVSISPNTCVIINEKPSFISVNEILILSTNYTKYLLQRELEIKLEELESDWHMSSLEKLFIEHKIYQSIEDCETWEDVLLTIDRGLIPFKPLLRREITRDDIIQLTEIKIKRISKFDGFKADEHIRGIEEQIASVTSDLGQMVEYTIKYFKRLLDKFSKGKERKTEITSFENIIATQVAVANQKLYVNRAEGFAGFGLKKDEFISPCSDIDDIIVFRENGTMMVTKVEEKKYIGKDILHVAVFKKSDSATVYNMVYQDGPNGVCYIKRFTVEGITRDKEYDLTKGTKGTKVLYFSISGENNAESIVITHKPMPRLKKLMFEFNFNELGVKGRASMGNILTRNPVRKIEVLDPNGPAPLPKPADPGLFESFNSTTTPSPTQFSSPDGEENKTDLFN